MRNQDPWSNTRFLGHAYPGVNMKTCHEWEHIEYIEATCPHCYIIDTYMFVGDVGDIVDCSNPKCKKQFKLGEQE